MIEEEYRDLKPELADIKEEMINILVKTYKTLKENIDSLGYTDLTDEELIDETIKRVQVASNKICQPSSIVDVEVGKYYKMRDHKKIVIAKIESINDVNISVWSMSRYGNGAQIPLSMKDDFFISEITNAKRIEAFNTKLDLSLNEFSGYEYER